MSIFARQTGRGDQISQAVASVNTALNADAATLFSMESAKDLLSLENLDVDRGNELDHSFAQAVYQLKQVAADNNLHLDDVSLEAAAIAAIGSADPVKYMDAALATGIKSGDGVVVPAEGMDYGVASLEAYDSNNITNVRSASIVFNMLSARQDSFGEAFFPTVVLAPTEAGLEIPLTLPTIMSDFRHSSTATADFKKRSLVDAIVDHTILAGDSTDVVPVYLADDSNAAFFVDKTLVATQSRLLAGETVATAPLAINVDLDLLGLSQGIGAINGQVLDQTDQLDARVALKTVYIKATEAVSGDVSVLAIPVLNSASSEFHPAAETSSGREVVLNFSTKDVRLTPSTVDVAGAAPIALDALVGGTNTYGISFRVSGEINLETGNANLHAGAVRIVSAQNAAGDELALTDGTVAPFIAATTLEVIGYDLKATKSNSNMRSRGQILDTTSVSERYVVPCGAPITAISPVGRAKGTEVKALIDGARVRTANLAVSTLVAHADTLRGNRAVGIARHLLKATLVEETLDVDARVSSIKSHERAEDVAAVLVDMVRTVAYRMVQESNYKAALEFMNPGQNIEPTVIVGTDPVIARHLMVSGDNRTAGPGFKEMKLVSTQDKRIVDKIYIALTCETGGQINPLSFGIHAYIPELAVEATVSRGGTSKEIQVQPRTRHIVNQPVLGVITVQNLDKALKDAA